MKDFLEKEMLKHEWQLKYFITSDSHKFYDVVFDKTRINFYLNDKYSSVECRIYIERNIYYTLKEVLEANDEKSDDVFWDHSNFTQIQYLKQYLKIIHSRLLYVIKGNLSWTNRANEIRINTMKIINKINHPSIFDSTIYKKMISRDRTWEDDLLNFSSKQ